MTRIYDNLTEFATKLVDFIAAIDKDHLIRIVKKAQQEYDAPKDSYFWGWFYSFTRLNSNKFKNFLKDDLSQLIIRLQAFERFFKEGKWESTSSNTRVYLALIKEIEGYDEETDYDLYQFIPRLSPLVMQEIKNRISFLQWQEANLKQQKDIINQHSESLSPASIRKRTQEFAKNYTNVENAFQKDRITLIISDDVKKIPRYQRKTGTYFLTREPDARTGHWVLYQKQKGKDDLQKINTDDWKKFHNLLANYDFLTPEQLNSYPYYQPCLTKNVVKENNKLYLRVISEGLEYAFIHPEGDLISGTVTQKELNYEWREPLRINQLPLSDILRIINQQVSNKELNTRNVSDSVENQIRDCINQQLKPKKQVLCKGVNDFSPQTNDSVIYKQPSFFIVTKREGQWKIFFVDSKLQEIKEVNREQCKEAKQMLDQWPEEPESLSEGQLEQLAKLLVDYKPVKPVNLNDFSTLDHCLATRLLLVQPSKENTLPASEKTETLQGKLDMTRYSEVAGFFSRRPIEIAPQDSSPSLKS
ncbi:hypothetical protein [Legionella fairfieldensis]|uniref:hypothetical protein n=1 Tax=Legionella fairfieldensis TaxID=45064 RepID=UPI00048EAB28|nr:hypothetical protein [Legionella fairfieldensis]